MKRLKNEAAGACGIAVVAARVDREIPYDSDPLGDRLATQRGIQSDRAAPEQPTARANPGWSPVAPLPAALAHRAVECVAPELPAPGHAIRVSCRELPRLCAARVHRHPAPALMRWLLERVTMRARTTAARVRQGVKYGIVMAAVYSAFAVFVRLSQGPEPFRDGGVSVPSLLLAYFSGGVVAGVLVGLLAPLARRLVGALLLGFIVAMPVMYFIAIAMSPVEEWDGEAVGVSIVAAAFLGPLCALGVRYVNRKLDAGW